MTVDDADRRILQHLQRDNGKPLHRLSEDVGLSVAAVSRRIQRLRETGVIARDVSIVDPSKIDHPLTIIVEVSLVSEQIAEIDAAKRAFMAESSVQQCYYVTGEADFVLVVVVATMADYEALTRRLFFGNHNVQRFRTVVVMDRVKIGLEVPV